MVLMCVFSIPPHNVGHGLMCVGQFPPCVVNSFLKLKRNKIRYDSTYYGMFMRFECFHQ